MNETKSVQCQLINAKRIHNWHTVRISTCEHPDDLPNMCQVSQSAAKIGTFSILKMYCDTKLPLSLM